MKKRLTSVLIYTFLLFLFGLTASSGAGAASSDDILAAIQKRYKGLQTLSAEYTRVTTTPSMEGVFQSSSTHTATGILLFKKPARLILNQATPRSERLVTNGKTVWWHIPEENAVHKYPDVDVYGEMKPLLDFLNGIDSLKGSFHVKVTPADAKKNPNHKLELTNLKETGGPAGITVWCSPRNFDLVGFRLVALTGEATVFNLKSVKTNMELKDDSFDFVPPKGVKIIEETGEAL